MVDNPWPTLKQLGCLLADSDDEDALGLSGSDEEDAGGGQPGGEGVLAEAARELTMLEEIQQASKKRQKCVDCQAAVS